MKFPGIFLLAESRCGCLLLMAGQTAVAWGLPGSRASRREEMNSSSPSQPCRRQGTPHSSRKGKWDLRLPQSSGAHLGTMRAVVPLLGDAQRIRCPGSYGVVTGVSPTPHSLGERHHLQAHPQRGWARNLQCSQELGS